MTLSAALSFYAMFALIPMALLMFFLLSQLVTSSGYATAKLAEITSNLVPKFSHRVMNEVYHAARQKAAWGVFGMFALLWAVTPLTSALRSAFYTIAGLSEKHSFIRRNLKDAIAVLSMLLMFFLFAISGLLLEKIVLLLRPLAAVPIFLQALFSLLVCALTLTAFYRTVFPLKIALRHLLYGALLTATLWFALHPAFSLILSLNQSFGTIFGGMKNLLISIVWLYYSLAVFLLGTELAAVLHKRDVLLLKELFAGQSSAAGRISEKLMRRFGRKFSQGEEVFREGDPGDEVYYVVSGTVELSHQGHSWRSVGAGEYFGEMAVLSSAVRVVNATVTSRGADILAIDTESFELLLLEDPALALSFLRSMATLLQRARSRLASQDKNPLE